MLSILWKILGWKPDNNGPSRSITPPAGPQIPPAGGDPLEDVPRYPPFDSGIPLKPIEQILQSQKELIERIYRASGLSKGEYERLVLPVIENLASCIHLLPATAIENHKLAGGLFRFSLEIGLNAIQGANASVFPIGGGIERRHFTQPRWALATLHAGLCSQIYRPLCSMTVLAQDGRQWQPFLSPLYSWGKAERLERYFIRWHEESSVFSTQGAAAFLASRVIPHEIMQYLAQDNSDIVPAMTAAISGSDTFGAGNPIVRIIAPLITRVIEEDLRSSSMNYGHQKLGLHLEPHLIDAMRRLAQSSWAINRAESVVLIGAEGVFLDWSRAAEDITELMRKDHFAGVPRHPDTLAELLCSAGVFILNKGQPFWEVVRPDAMQPCDTAVKLAHPAIILKRDTRLDEYLGVRLLLAQPEEEIGESAQEETAPKPGKRKKNKTGQAEVQQEEDPRQVRLFDPSEPAQAQEKEGKETAAAGKPPQSAGERLLAAIKPEHAAMIRVILVKTKEGGLTGHVAAIPNGLGISLEELSSHGVHVPSFIEDLSNHKWLWQDATKPLRNMHAVEHDGGRDQMVILRRDIATALGFKVA